MVCADVAEHDTVSVVCRYPIGKFQVLSEPLFLHLCKCFDLCPFICIPQQMLDIRLMTVILHYICMLFDFPDQPIILHDRFWRDSIFLEYVMEFFQSL